VLASLILLSALLLSLGLILPDMSQILTTGARLGLLRMCVDGVCSKTPPADPRIAAAISLVLYAIASSIFALLLLASRYYAFSTFISYLVKVIE
jgi:mannose/fructose/N-acetylgalactosamine-specific phosphotransferase system component IIC